MGNSQSNDVALGDLNSDGFVDIFLANDGAVEVWLNNGSGLFTLYWTSPVIATSKAVALGDIDNDSDLDAFIAKNGANELWINDGTGNFGNDPQLYGSGDSTDIAVGDFNKDGYSDFVITNYATANVVWFNDGTGSFFTTSLPSASNNSNGVAVGDLNNDGHTDIFIANNGANEILLNNGTGNFQSFWTSPNSKVSYSLALGDLNGDSHLDAFITNGNAANEIWLNNGNGTFTDSGQAIGGNALSTGIALGDFDADGDLDAFITNGVIPGPDKVFLNDGTGNFTDSGQIFSSNTSSGVALTDLNNDGSIDAMVSGTFGATVWFNALPGITVTAPSQSESWTIGSNQIIKWISFNVSGNVSIELSADNGNSWTTVAADTANDGAFEWLVTGSATDQALIKITPLTDENLLGVSGIFSLVYPAPVAMIDTYTVEQNGNLIIDAANGVLANDDYNEQQVLTAQLVSQPSHGTLSLASDGSFTYVPGVDYFGNDTFIYQATDGVLESNEAVVSITVSLTNNSPSAVADEYTTQVNTTLTIGVSSGVLTNDSDADNDTLTAILAASPSNGTLDLNSDGSFTYIPSSDFSGTDSFGYRAFDGYEYSSLVTVTINVEDNSPAIIMNPNDITVEYGSDAVFVALAVGNPTPSVQWQESLNNGLTWVDIPSATESTYTVEQPDIAFDGKLFRATYANIYGTAYTSAAILSVTPRQITVAADNADKVYGDGDPSLNYRLEVGSLVDGDSFTGSIIRESGEIAGNYEISQGSLSLNSNYIVTFVGAVFKIDPRPASVTPNNNSKFEGEPDPVLTGILTGFLPEDRISVSFRRNSGETIGAYEIIVELSPEEILTNYAIVIYPAIFSIVEDPSPIILFGPQHQSIIYGGNATFTAAAIGNPSPSTQWQFSDDDGKNWQNLESETGNSITLFSPKIFKHGYLYRVVFTNEYGVAVSESAILTINQKIVSPNAIVDDKIYDGTTQAHIISLYLSGYLESDDITLTGGNAIFDSSSLGENKVVTVTGLHLSGSDMTNYQLSSTTALTNANILSPTFNGGEFDGSKITGVGFFGTLPFMGEDGLTSTNGLVTTENGQMSLSIVSGTSVISPSTGASITLSATLLEEYPTSPPEHTLVSAYELGPAGTIFSPAITLTWHYDGLLIPENAAEGEIIAVFWNGANWVEMISTIDPITKTITAQTNHFSIFGLMVPKPATDLIDHPAPEPTQLPPDNPVEPTPNIPVPSMEPSPSELPTADDFDYRYLVAALIGALLVGLILLATKPRPN